MAKKTPEQLKAEEQEAARLKAEAKAKEQEADRFKAEAKVEEREAPPDLGDMVFVRPLRGYKYEPFQLLPIPEGQDTPLVYTAWVKSQCDARQLKVIKVLKK